MMRLERSFGKSFTLFVVLAALNGLAAGCSSAGETGGADDGSVDDPDEGDDGGGGVLDPSPDGVSGRFYLGDVSRPAAGYELWIADQTTPSYLAVTLDASGAFSLPLSAFREGHRYSLHLVENYRYLVDIDLSAALAGTQNLFRYEGGYGFDLGQVIVTLTTQDMVDSSVAPLGQIGGGFQLDTNQELSLADFNAPANVSDFGIGSQLLIFDPAALLYGVYRSDDYPHERTRVLGEHSRIAINLNAVTSKVTRVFAVYGPRWLDNARLAVGDEAQWAQSPRWVDQDYALDAIASSNGDSETIFRASVFSGGLPVSGTILVLKTQPDAGAQSIVPKVLPRVLIEPPRLLAYTDDGGTPMAIDYSSEGVDNGLLQPLCQSGDVVLTLRPPFDETNAAPADGVLNRIVLGFDYYGQSAGRSEPLVVEPSAFPSGLSLENATWDATLRTVTYNLNTASAEETEHTVTLPAELFLDSSGEANVTHIRLRIYYRSSTEATEGGSAVWFKKSCGG